VYRLTAWKSPANTITLKRRVKISCNLQKAAKALPVRPSGLELTHCSSPPPLLSFCRIKVRSSFLSKQSPLVCLKCMMCTPVFTALWPSALLQASGAALYSMSKPPYSRPHAPAWAACLVDVACPLNHALPINARTAALQGRRVIDPSPPSKDASPSIQSTLRNTSHHRTVGGKINDSTSSHLAPSTPIHLASPHATPMLVLSSQAIPSDSSTQTSTLTFAHAVVFPRPKSRKLNGGALRCMVRGCRSVKTNHLRPHISRRLYARRAAALLPIHPAKAPQNQSTTKTSAQPVVATHPTTIVEPACILRKSRGLSLQPPQLTPPFCSPPPDLAVSVVARGHPTEASLQLLALEARLPFVARASLHKSKKDSSLRSWPPWRERARTCARLFDRPLGIATCPTIHLIHPPPSTH
jgi:hypothetical protein